MNANDEAREAAIPEREATPDEAFRLGEVTGYDEGFVEGHAAGVAEGIRQAREAVAGRLADPAVSSSPAVLGVVDALAAIDALGEETERGRDTD